MNKLFTTIILITGLLAAVCLGASAIHSNTAGDIIKNNVTSLLEEGHTPESLLEKVLDGFDINLFISLGR